MRLLLTATLLITLLLVDVESRIRCRRTPDGGCRRPKAPGPPPPREPLRVTWSSDGRHGTRYFEKDGRHFLETQQLIPIPGGKYEVRKNVIETTAPPTPVRHAHGHPPEENAPIQLDDTWFEPPGQNTFPKLFFSPHQGWREITEDEVRRIRQIRPLAEYDPLLTAPVEKLPPGIAYKDPTTGEFVDENGNYVNPLVERRVDNHGRVWVVQGGNWHLADDQRAPSYTSQEPRIEQGWILRDGKWHPHRTEQPAGAGRQPEQVPSGQDGRHIHEGRIQDGWIMLNGQWHPYDARHQPSTHGVSQPSAPHVGGGAVPSEGHRHHHHHEGKVENGWIFRGGKWLPLEPRQPHTPEQRHPQPADQRQPYPHVQGLHSRHEGTIEQGWIFRGGRWHPHDGRHYQPHPSSAPSTAHGHQHHYGEHTEPQHIDRLDQEADTLLPENIAPVRSGDWVQRDGTWFYEPQGESQGTGEWVYKDGRWVFEYPGQQTVAQTNTVPEAVARGVRLETGGVQPNVVKVRKFHLPTDVEHEHRLVEKTKKIDNPEQEIANNTDTANDYTNWYYSFLDQGTTEATPEADDTIETNPEFEEEGSAQYFRDGEGDTVTFSEEGNIAPGSPHSSYFIREGNVGAMVYSESGDEGEGGERIAQASTDGGLPVNFPKMLSVDEFQHLQPSDHAIVPLAEGAAQLQCDGAAENEASGQYWLLRAEPCGEDSKEGRILLPNGEVLKFYGNPQLVHP
ncbi:hypothetical protein Q1695_008885 [Nippostrongylus brasiliensis]|nr:hypothetical protein Q1695_008885 [Nippostrongylus brasiliensis]